MLALFHFKSFFKSVFIKYIHCLAERQLSSLLSLPEVGSDHEGKEIQHAVHPLLLHQLLVVAQLTTARLVRTEKYENFLNIREMMSYHAAVTPPVSVVFYCFLPLYLELKKQPPFAVVRVPVVVCVCAAPTCPPVIGPFFASAVLHTAASVLPRMSGVSSCLLSVLGANLTKTVQAI